MKTMFGAILAALVLAAPPALAAPDPAAPNLAAPNLAAIAADLAAHPPADLDGYYHLRQKLGPDALIAVNAELSKLYYGHAGIAMEGQIAACRLPAELYEEQAALDLARSVADDNAWRQARADIAAALARRDAIQADARAGKDVDPSLGGAMWPYREALKATDPRLKELAGRVGDDQFARLSTNVLGSHTLWAAGLTPVVADYLRALSAAEGCRVDNANLQWLKADLAAHGWPKISQYGAGADSQAWLLVQHADQDLPFQREVLTLLEALLPAKETSAKNYAYLYDRVAVAEGRPQRYGTQGHCTGPGTWASREVEDPANLDKRRAEMGLNSELEYMKMFPFCTTPPPGVK